MTSRTPWCPWRSVTFSATRACLVLGAAAAAVAGSAAALAAAPAPPRWLPPRDLSRKGADAVIPDVSFDRKGNAIVVWAEAKGSTWTVEAVERPPGGPWGAPLALSAPAGHVASPQLAVAGDSAVAVWARYDGRNLIVQASSRDSKTHTWTSPTPLSARGRDAQTPSVAVDARGDAVAVWASVTGSVWGIESSYRPAGGSWQTPVALQTPTAGTAAPDVVIDGTGRAVAVWAATTAGGWRVHAATRGTEGSWSSSQTLSGPDATGSIAPELALEGTNDVLAVWSRSIGSGTVIESAAMNAATGTWAPAVQTFTLPHDALAPSVAVDKRGDGAIVWTSSDQTGLSVMASYRRSGRSWGRPAALSGTASSAQSPQVALDARGDALAVWTQSVNGFSRVDAASLRAGGTWSAGRLLSRGAADALTARVALDQGGDGAAVWARYDGRSFVIQSGGYDASGPALGNLSMPATGVVGRRLTFTVTPRDVWTTVGTIRWSFGDGSTESGRATGHVYTRPGTYLARLTVTDAFGHATSVRRLVKISAA